jgi:hypothetical protein
MKAFGRTDEKYIDSLQRRPLADWPEAAKRNPIEFYPAAGLPAHAILRTPSCEGRPSFG